jgi:hypothetical protein
MNASCFENVLSFFSWIPWIYMNRYHFAAALHIGRRMWLCPRNHNVSSSLPNHSTWCPKSLDSSCAHKTSSPRMNLSVILATNMQVLGECHPRVNSAISSFKQRRSPLIPSVGQGQFFLGQSCSDVWRGVFQSWPHVSDHRTWLPHCTALAFMLSPFLANMLNV